MKTVILTLIAASMLAACTDTDRAKFSAWGDSGRVICYSGGTKIVDAKSTGRVQKESTGADGFAWMDASDGLLHESNADCVVIHGAQP